jgi:hypothetical protein
MGRIQMLRGNDAEARRLFDAAATDSQSRVTRYLANLFLGSMDEREGHPDAAERRYRAAMGFLPRAQSGRPALTALLARSGRGADGARILTDPESRRPSFDPWWTYINPDVRDFASLLAELHAEIVQ